MSKTSVKEPADPEQRNRAFLHGLNLALMIGFVYVIMEWIFQITKISFLDPLSFGEKLTAFILAASAATLIVILLMFIAFLLDASIGRISPIFRRYAYTIPAALLLASLILILFDNFTYTVFFIGVVFAVGVNRIAYLILFLLLFLICLVKLNQSSSPFWGKSILPIISTLIVVSSFIIVGVSFTSNKGNQQPTIQTGSLDETPNIIFLSSDMLDASNMSVYGYQRDTTPFLRELAATSLLGLNTFTNATTSIASETSVLTGKLPSTTRVLANPDYLLDDHQYQHLPGILKEIGYKTISLGVPYYVDADLIQFQNAFDDVNCSKQSADRLSVFFTEIGLNTEYIFLGSLLDRISERLLHIFFIEEMEYPFMEVVNYSYYPAGDEKRLNCLYEYLEDSNNSGQPLFAHVHLMGTHGPGYILSNPVFSKGETQTDPFETDFYDDSLLDFDQVVEKLVEYLKENNIFENTILVIYTDHPQKYLEAVRTPLLIHFPQDQYSGEIASNTQSIDIAPTILEYLGIQKPEWLEGNSLLGDLEPDRLIFAFTPLPFSDAGGGVVEVSYLDREPPFYQFSKITVIQGSAVHSFDLKNQASSFGEVTGYSGSAGNIQLNTHEEIKEITRQLMIEAGFEVPGDW